MTHYECPRCGITAPPQPLPSAVVMCARHGSDRYVTMRLVEPDGDTDTERDGE